MAKRLSTFDARMHTAIVIGLCFLLTSAGWLSWLYRIMGLVRPELVDPLTLVLGYLFQGVGVGVYMLAEMRHSGQGGQESHSRRVFALALVLHLVLLVPTTLTTNLATTLIFGYLTNVLCGVIQGYYLSLLASHVEHGSRGLVFGCAYGASTFLTWLLSLPGGGVLTRGVPCLLVCLVLNVCILGLVFFSPPVEDGAIQPGNAVSRETVRLACATVVMASLVKTVGFSFPATDLAAGTNLELSRILYGAGLVAAGIASDRDRRAGLALCVASLVMPFLMLTLSSAGVSGTPLWALGYLLTGIYVLFSVLLFADLAAETGHPQFAGTGMLLRHVGDALGTTLFLSLANATVVLVGVVSILFLVTIGLFFALYLQMFGQPPVKDRESNELMERSHFESFASCYELSGRERDVLRLVLDEKSNAEIASDLFVSERTVKFHMTNLLRKTGCRNRLEVLAKYAEH